MLMSQRYFCDIVDMFYCSVYRSGLHNCDKTRIQGSLADARVTRDSSACMKAPMVEI